MTQSNVARVMPPALPSTYVDLMAHRRWKIGVSLNDAVDEIHKSLWEDEDYQRLLYATYDEHAVEGSLAADNIEAARMVRTYATKIGSVVAREKLATIAKALGVVLRRYGLSRKERRMQVGDTMVEADEIAK